MIVRSWQGFATRDNADQYVQHLREDVFPVLDNILGFRGIEVLRRDAGNEVEFLVLTRWDSMDAIRQFAGEQPEVAVVAGGARTVLSRWSDRVDHYRVAASVR